MQEQSDRWQGGLDGRVIVCASAVARGKESAVSSRLCALLHVVENFYLWTRCYKEESRVCIQDETREIYRESLTEREICELQETCLIQMHVYPITPYSRSPRRESCSCASDKLQSSCSLHTYTQILHVVCELVSASQFSRAAGRPCIDARPGMQKLVTLHGKQERQHSSQTAIHTPGDQDAPPPFRIPSGIYTASAIPAAPGTRAGSLPVPLCAVIRLTSRFCPRHRRPFRFEEEGMQAPGAGAQSWRWDLAIGCSPTDTHIHFTNVALDKRLC